jgi:hypothetical protein
MTPEQRLDRLERIAKLLAKAGLRARTEFRKQYEILMDAQMRNEVRFERNEERFAILAEAQTRLADSQTHTDERLDALIDIIRKRNGNSLGST